MSVKEPRSIGFMQLWKSGARELPKTWSLCLPYDAGRESEHAVTCLTVMGKKLPTGSSVFAAQSSGDLSRTEGEKQSKE